MHRQNCLTESQLASLVGGELAAKEEAAAEAHLSRCRSCRSQLSELLADTRPVVDQPAPEDLKRIARGMVPGQTSPRRLWLPLAAAVLVAIGIGYISKPVMSDRSGGDEVLRELPARIILELEVPLSGGLAAGERTLFSWEPIESARRYDFVLVNEVGDIVFDASTAQASVELLRGNLAIEPGGAYYWSVRALLRDGTVVESELRKVAF